MPAGMFVDADNRRFDPDVTQQLVIEQRLDNLSYVRKRRRANH